MEKIDKAVYFNKLLSVYKPLLSFTQKEILKITAKLKKNASNNEEIKDLEDIERRLN